MHNNQLTVKSYNYNNNCFNYESHRHFACDYRAACVIYHSKSHSNTQYSRRVLLLRLLAQSGNVYTVKTSAPEVIAVKRNAGSDVALQNVKKSRDQMWEKHNIMQ